MPYRLCTATLLMLALAATASAQQPAPLNAPQPLPPPSSLPQGGPAPSASPEQASPPQAAPETAPAPSRVFCDQSVGYRLADPASVPELYRPFVGIWSDADWTPQLCAALIVEAAQGDGTAVITYAFGPIGSGIHTPGGVLNGTGLIRDGELRFQNSDGSQFLFKLFYSDLQGQLTTPQGQTYQAVFKRTY
jgi:hypothetical protein